MGDRTFTHRKTPGIRPAVTRSQRLAFETVEPRLMLDAGSVMISEFMAINQAIAPTNLTDEDGDYSDWIELNNPTSSPIDISGWHLTDDPGSLDQWQFPAETLDPGEFLVVFASDKDRAVAGSAGEYTGALGYCVVDPFFYSFSLSLGDHRTHVAVLVEFRAESSAGANDGIFSLKRANNFDPSTFAGKTNSQMGSAGNNIDEAYIGAPGGVDAGTVGSYYLDSFESYRTLAP